MKSPRTQEEIHKKIEIRRNKLELQRLREITKIGTWYLDIESNEVTWSKELYEMYGFDPNLPPPPYTEHMKLFTRESWDLLSESLDKTAKTGIPYELELKTIRKDGSNGWMWVRGEAISNEKGQIEGLWGAAQDISSHKVSQAQLAEALAISAQNEQFLIDSQDIGNLVSYIYDLEKDCWSSSIKLDEIFGIDESFDRSSKGWKSIIHPDHQEEMLSYLFEHVIRDGNAFNKEYRIIRVSDVQTRWVHGRGKLTYTEAGLPKSMIGTIQDVTDRMSKELALKAASEKLETQNEELAVLNEELAAVIEEHQSLNEELVTTNEELSANLDLRRQKEAELIAIQKDLQWSNERLESLLRISQFKSDNVQVLLDFALAEAIKLTGSEIGYIYYYKEKERQFVLNTWSKQVMKECRVLNPKTTYNLEDTGCWGEAVRQRKPIVINDYEQESPLKRGTPEGHIKLHRFLTIPVFSDNQIVAVAGCGNKKEDYTEQDIKQLTLLMDSVWKITERFTLVEELKAAQRKSEESDRLKSAFLANMSHEIRTPLNGILGFTELLADSDISQDQRERYLSMITGSGERWLELINNLVDISKIEAGQIYVYKSATNVKELLDKLHGLFQPEAAKKKLQIHLECSCCIPTILTDRSLLEAILVNLIKNAIKFTPAGSILVGCKREDHDIIFQVKDTGPGILPENYERIFERFHREEMQKQNRSEGAGLGLAISKSYVEALGGKIWVESELGAGCTFFFSLPL